MSASISDTFAQQLRQRRDDLLLQLRAQRGGRVGRAEAAADALSNAGDDRPQADAERDLAMALQERETAELVAIDAALQRIADGRFGVCANCGGEMETARLHANPTALRCVACQTAFERNRPAA